MVYTGLHEGLQHKKIYYNDILNFTAIRLHDLHGLQVFRHTR